MPGDGPASPRRPGPRYAGRILRSYLVFTLTATSMLAIGIGINVAAFGFFNVVVLRSLPVREPATLLKFQRIAPQHASDNLPYAAVAFYREHARTLSTVLAVHESTLALEDDAQPIDGHYVTANLFQDLGGAAAIGRTLNAQDDELPRVRSWSSATRSGVGDSRATARLSDDRSG